MVHCYSAVLSLKLYNNMREQGPSEKSIMPNKNESFFGFLMVHRERASAMIEEEMRNRREGRNFSDIFELERFLRSLPLFRSESDVTQDIDLVRGSSVRVGEGKKIELDIKARIAGRKTDVRLFLSVDSTEGAGVKKVMLERLVAK